MRKILILLIKIYKYTFSYFIGRQCRFIPSCSDYAIESISKHGVIKGSKLAIKRIIRCRPNGESGYDPPP